MHRITATAFQNIEEIDNAMYTFLFSFRSIKEFVIGSYSTAGAVPLSEMGVSFDPLEEFFGVLDLEVCT